jgi:hypothetical protein
MMNPKRLKQSMVYPICIAALLVIAVLIVIIAPAMVEHMRVNADITEIESRIRLQKKMTKIHRILSQMRKQEMALLPDNVVLDERDEATFGEVSNELSQAAKEVGMQCRIDAPELLVNDDGSKFAQKAVMHNVLITLHLSGNCLQFLELLKQVERKWFVEEVLAYEIVTKKGEQQFRLRLNTTVTS